MIASEVIEVLSMFIKEHGDKEIDIQLNHKLGMAVTYVQDGDVLGIQFYSNKVVKIKRKKQKPDA